MTGTHEQRIRQSEIAPPIKDRSFEDILQEHIPKLWATALQFCRYDQPNAKDLLQDAMIRAFEYRDSLVQAENHFAWLRRTLLTTHLNRLRDSKRWDAHEGLSEAESVPIFDAMPISRSLSEVFQKDLWDDDIIRALDALPEVHRMIILLADIHEYSYQEISELTGVAKGTVSAILCRSRRLLATALQEYAISHGFLSRTMLDDEADQRNGMEAM